MDVNKVEAVSCLMIAILVDSSDEEESIAIILCALNENANNLNLTNSGKSTNISNTQISNTQS